MSDKPTDTRSDQVSEPIDDGIRALLATLDPERSDPGYWLRFQRWAVNSAAPELARRRRLAAATVSDVMMSWWRTLVPTAAVAALLAGFVLLRDQTPEAPIAYMNVDEQILEGVEAPVMPAFEMADADGGIVVVNEVF
jgi:hypothetical protein